MITSGISLVRPSFKGGMEVTGSQRALASIEVILLHRSEHKNPFKRIPIPQSVLLESDGINKTVLWGTKKTAQEINEQVIQARMSYASFDGVAKTIVERVRKFVKGIEKYTDEQVLKAMEDGKFSYRNMKIRK